MRMNRIGLLAIGAAAWPYLAPAPSVAEEAAGLTWLSSLADAKRAAAASGKFLLLDFYAPG